MTRQIRFRAIHIPDKKIRYDVTIAFCNNDVREYRIYEDDEFHPEQDIRYTRGAYLGNDKHWELSQSTGLKDKHGKEIYEGDIIRGYLPSHAAQPTEIKSDVTFKEGLYSFMQLNDTPVALRELIEVSNTKECNFAGVEIIGNIYENPELLNQE